MTNKTPDSFREQLIKVLEESREDKYYVLPPLNGWEKIHTPSALDAICELHKRELNN
jgi:hypothetical protein